MKRLLWIALVIGCGNDVRTNEPAPDAGAVDLFQQNCARCHGSDAEGTTKAPQIREPVHAYAEYVIRNGRADEMGFGQAMPGFSTDDLPDLTPIFAYLDRAPHPTDGAGLYARFCGNCHGADARGGRVDKDILDETDDIAEKVREGHGGTSYSARTKYMPAWSTAALSDADVSAIAAYLSGLPGGGGGDDD